MKHKHVKIYFFKNTPKYSNNGGMRTNQSLCVATTTSCISALILKTGQATRNLQAAYRMNGHGLIIFMMNWVMSIHSAKCEKRRNCIHGGQIVGRPVQKMWVGGLTIRPVHLTGKCGLQTHGCIKNNGLATMPLSLLTIKYTNKWTLVHFDRLFGWQIVSFFVYFYLSAVTAL